MDPKNPITLLVPLIGIALILLAVWLTGGARRARLDRALVVRRLGEDLPGFAASEIVIDATGNSAIVHGLGGAVAVLFTAGDRVVVRAIGRHDLVRASAEGERLLIETGDFAHGRLSLTLPGTAARWAALLASP